MGPVRGFFCNVFIHWFLELCDHYNHNWKFHVRSDSVVVLHRYLQLYQRMWEERWIGAAILRYQFVLQSVFQYFGQFTFYAIDLASGTENLFFCYAGALHFLFFLLSIYQGVQTIAGGLTK